MFWYWTFIACGLRFVPFLSRFLPTRLKHVQHSVCLFFRWWMLQWRNFVDVFFAEPICSVCDISMNFLMCGAKETGSMPRFASDIYYKIIGFTTLPLHGVKCCAPSLSIFMRFFFVFFSSLYCKHVAWLSACHAPCQCKYIPNHITVKRKLMLTLGRYTAEAITYYAHLHVHFHSWPNVE